ncbi:MAG: hypothetical protein ACYCUG_06195, partial [Acidimicrobiales bacterium]
MPCIDTGSPTSARPLRSSHLLRTAHRPQHFRRHEPGTVARRVAAATLPVALLPAGAAATAP